MAREDIEFKTYDGVTLRGWFYKPLETTQDTKLPCLVMSHGLTALKEMDLDMFASYFTHRMPLACLVYDNRGFGSSDTKDGEPRFEIIPSKQVSDYSDAITYASTRPDVNPSRIGIWGSSYSGGHVLWVGAVDKRVKAVLTQVPLISGWENINRLIRSDFMPSINQLCAQDRLDRAAGKDPGTIAVVDENPLALSALPTVDSYQFFSAWKKKSEWKNVITIRSVEELRAYEPATHIHHISPTPLLMTVARNDVLTPTDLAIAAYARALEPKELHILPGGHFEGYSGPNFERNAGRQAEFLKRTLCASE